MTAAATAKVDAINVVKHVFPEGDGRRDFLVAKINEGKVDPASIIERFSNITRLDSPRQGGTSLWSTRDKNPLSAQTGRVVQHADSAPNKVVASGVALPGRGDEIPGLSVYLDVEVNHA